jgi:hypothetical protein
MNQLLVEIEAFIATHRMSPSRFGTGAVNDQHLIKDMKNGRRLWPETEQKVRLFMATYRAEAA